MSDHAKGARTSAKSRRSDILPRLAVWLDRNRTEEILIADIALKFGCCRYTALKLARMMERDGFATIRRQPAPHGGPALLVIEAGPVLLGATVETPQ